MTDPTLDFLARFDDPSQWDAVIPNVPIFVEHERAGPDGKVAYAVDEAKLRTIADRINTLLTEHGVVLRVTRGHTKLIPDPADPKRKIPAPQSEQPPIVAFGKGASVGPFGPEGELAVVTTFYYRKGYGQDANDYPYRSAEYYPSTGEIRGVAVLATDPALDMGMTCYHAAGTCYYYDRENIREDAMAEEKKEKEGKPDEVKKLEEGMAAGKPADPTKPPDDKAPRPTAADELSPEETAMAERFCRHYEKHHPAFKAMCAHYASMAMPSGTNGAMPANPAEQPPGGGQKPVATEKKEPEQMSRTDTPTLYDERIKKLEAENLKIRQDYARSEATAIMKQLRDVEGYHFTNPDREVERLAGMTAEQREERIAEIREHYQRDPAAGRPLEVYNGPMPGSGEVESEDLTERDMPAFEQYMRDHPGADFEDGKEYAIARRKGKGKKPAA